MQEHRILFSRRLYCSKVIAALKIVLLYPDYSRPYQIRIQLLRLIKLGIFVTREYTFSRSSTFLEQFISNSYITGGTWSMEAPAISYTFTKIDRNIPSAVSCILWRSITDAQSSLTGRGVLLTTTRRCHCSQTTRSSFETRPKSCWVFLRSKKLKVNPPYIVYPK